MEIYFWQKEAWQVCCQRIRQDRLPHALLLHARAGFGLEDFAKLLAHYCLCQPTAAKETMPCGRCAACKLFSSGNHPDFVLLDGAANRIKIEHVRQLDEFIYSSSHSGSYRVVLINQADSMTVQAANSLLKSLEEPPAKCLFFLVTYWPSRLLVTIRSRCQEVRLAVPSDQSMIAWLAESAGIDRDQAQEWLELYNHRPLHALQALGNQSDDPMLDKKSFFTDVKACILDTDLFLPTVEKWHKQQAELVHQWLLELLSMDFKEQVKKGGKTAELDRLYRLYDRQSKRYLQLGNNLNPRLHLESALTEWMLLMRR